MRTRLLFYSFLIFSFVSCNEDNPPGLSLFAQNFLDEMLNVMEKNSINKKTIDWEEFRTRVYAKAAGAETLAEIYPAITEALTLLGDNHSVFIGPTGNTISVHTIQCNTQTVAKPTLPYNVGYVRVSQFGGDTNGSAAIAFAREIQDQIKSQDSPDIIGWIVDVRSNLGGNMWPMVAGIGPVLGEGIAGYFIDPDGLGYSWGYSDGASVNEGVVVSQVVDPYELIVPNPKVAVLLTTGLPAPVK
jgi:C-terminal processing protease CtpA/Prc